MDIHAKVAASKSYTYTVDWEIMQKPIGWLADACKKHRLLEGPLV